MLTAANSSNLNDGAAAVLLGSEAVKRYDLKPIARIIAYADAAQSPEWFTTSPSVAIQKVLKNTGLFYLI
jgi:acetyl-CoA C-acetyltransferase